MDGEKLQNRDTRKEAVIRENLEYYKDKRLLKAKFQRQLDEHLAETGRSEKEIVERIKNSIVARIYHG